jgi:hypothetical protein
LAAEAGALRSALESAERAAADAAAEAEDGSYWEVLQLRQELDSERAENEKLRLKLAAAAAAKKEAKATTNSVGSRNVERNSHNHHHHAVAASWSFPARPSMASESDWDDEAETARREATAASAKHLASAKGPGFAPLFAGTLRLRRPSSP